MMMVTILCMYCRVEVNCLRVSGLSKSPAEIVQICRIAKLDRWPIQGQNRSKKSE